MDCTRLFGGEIRYMPTEWVQVRITGQPSITLPPPGPTDTWLTAADGGRGANRWSFHQIKQTKWSALLILNEFFQAYLFGFSPSNLFQDLAKSAPSREVMFLSLACAGKCFTQTFWQLYQPAPSPERNTNSIVNNSLKSMMAVNQPALFWIFRMHFDRKQMFIGHVQYWSRSWFNDLPLANIF